MGNKTTRFREIFGYSIKVKMLEWMLIWRMDLTFNDVLKGAGVNRTNGYKALDNFLDNGIIKESKKVKNIQFYQLNMKNPVVKELIVIFDTILKEDVRKTIKIRDIKKRKV